MQRLQCVLWDHDDTLMSTFALRARATAYAAEAVFNAQIDGAAFLARTHGLSLEQFALEFSDEPGMATRFVEVYRDWYYSHNHEGLEVYDGIREVLSTLAGRGVLMGVVTAKHGQGARDELQAAGLRQWLPEVAGAGDVARTKPDPQALELVMSALGATPDTTIMVGDTPADINGARAAGTRSAAALWGTVDRDAVLAAGPDHTLEQPSALLDLL